jgi:hypothetical protein
VSLRKITELTAATAVTTDDLFVVVDDPAGTEETKKITAANVAASAPFTAAFLPATTFVHSKLWDVATGGPAYSASALGVAGQRHGGMLFDGAAQEVAYAWAPLPLVTTFDLWLRWANPSATAGDVVWQASYEFVGVGDTMDAFTAGSQITVTSPAQNVVGDVRLLAGISRGTATSIGIKIGRRGDVAGDTVNSVDVAGIAFYITAAA